MTPQDIRNLIVLTLRSPAAAAQQILSMNLGREVLWTALFLAAVVNTFFLTFQKMIMDPGADADLPIMFASPGIYFAIVAGGQVLFIYALYLVGGMFRGTGSLNQVMALMVWLQLLQVAAQAIVVGLSLFAPPLAVILHMAGVVYGLYILVHFIDQAHQLKSMGRAAAVLSMTLVVLAVALSLLVALTGRY